MSTEIEWIAFVMMVLTGAAILFLGIAELVNRVRYHRLERSIESELDELAPPARRPASRPA